MRHYVIVGTETTTGRVFLVDVNGQNVFDKETAFRERDYFNDHISPADATYKVAQLKMVEKWSDR